MQVDADVSEEKCSAVRKMLEELSFCEMGYAGSAPCKTCGLDRECADTVDRALKQAFPSTDWAPAIRHVLGQWEPSTPPSTP